MCVDVWKLAQVYYFKRLTSTIVSIYLNFMTSLVCSRFIAAAAAATTTMSMEAEDSVISAPSL